MKRSTAVLIACFACLGLPSVAQVAGGPNVILFVVDDMGWADWEARSDFYETPNMTRLANMGVEFTDAYASASICSPTRASLMTGLSPASHGMTKWIPGNPNNKITNPNEPESVWNLQDGYVTIGEVFQQNAYETVHLGKWHLGETGNPAADPTNHGFDTNIGGNHRGSPPSYTNRSSYINNLPGLDNTINENYITDHLAQEAQNYIEDRVANNEKFFMNFDLYAVHTPIQAHPDYINYFQTKPDGQVHDNAAYATMLKAMDDALGKVLDTLEAQEIDDETVVIFTSDHGGLTSPAVTSNAPLRGGKGQQWEGGHRVPMIIAGPGIQSGAITGYQAISHDLYPTILELAGLTGDTEHNEAVEGLSLAGVLNGTTTGDREEALFWHFPHMSNHNGGPYGAVVLGDWKFIENYDTHEQYLYNLANDLGEGTNLIETEVNQGKLLRALLHEYLGETGASLWNGFELSAIRSGDLDGNGIIDDADLEIVLANWGQSVDPFSSALGDPSGDGLVNHDDLHLVLRQFGTGDSGLGLDVPEPSSLAMFSLLLLTSRLGR